VHNFVPNKQELMHKILVIGACGQLGTELVDELRKRHGNDQVVASDLKKEDEQSLAPPYIQLNAMDDHILRETIEAQGITQAYHLAAVLSAKAEERPLESWDINMRTLIAVLELAREQKIEKIFWPSSIAVFGPDTPKLNTPQFTLMNPNTIYGISKLAGERWCEYYHQKHGVDVRSLRYPGLIGYKSLPGGGTTDYAVDIFHKAILEQPFNCFLGKDTRLPMMYMNDAVKATLELMDAPSERIKVRSSYNIAAFSFTPEEIHREITELYPDFQINYQPDMRQQIADSWPDSIDDSVAQLDWGWKPGFDLPTMVGDILRHLPSLLKHL
jgi:nucleoside-diphosphate-sugar epimerase